MKRRDELTRLFDAIDDDGKRYVLAVLRGEYKRVCASLPRPRLQLIDCTKVIPGLTKGNVDPVPVSGAG
jgi:hypothetical protein